MEMTLKQGINYFIETVKLLAEDAEKSVDNDEFEILMQTLWDNHLVKVKDSKNPGLNLKLLIETNQNLLGSLQFNLITTLSNVPPETLRRVLTEATNISKAFNPALGALVEQEGKNAISLLKHGTKIACGLAAVALAYVVFKNIYRWYTGEISGKRCAKLILDSISSLAGGVAVGCAGAAIGGCIGPVGMVLGGVIGGLIGGKSIELAADWLTRKIFDLPKEEAVENAYNFLGVKQNASNDEINKKFRTLCLKYHPDKGGKAEDFQKLQISMAVIKFSRGEVA
jgi:hypothetical protein